jgi:hypothetical protein
MQNVPLEQMFTRSWTVLRSNVSIIFPGVLAGIVAGIAQALLAPSVFAGGSFGWTIASIIGLFAAVMALTYTTGMAQVAWERGHTSFADGKCAFVEDGRRVAFAVVLLAVTAAVAMLLAFLTLGLSLLAFAYFAVYTIASVVVGRHTAIEGLVESAKIASQRIVPTAAVLVGFIGVFVTAGCIGFVLSFIPLLGPIAASIIVQTCAAYFAVVIVGEYLTARGTPPPVPMPIVKP